MKKLFFLPILLLLFLAVISCEKDQMEPATESNELQEQVTFRANATVPFKGKYDVLVEPVSPDVIPGSFTAKLDAYGKATHLGKSTWESVSTIYDLFSSPDPDPDIGGWVQDGTMIFTAANGSQLFGSFIGVFDGLGGNGTYEITRGNGRFVGATGEGTYFWISVEDAPNYLEFNGTLTNP